MNVNEESLLVDIICRSSSLTMSPVDEDSKICTLIQYTNEKVFSKAFTISSLSAISLFQFEILHVKRKSNLCNMRANYVK